MCGDNAEFAFGLVDGGKGDRGMAGTADAVVADDAALLAGVKLALKECVDCAECCVVAAGHESGWGIGLVEVVDGGIVAGFSGEVVAGDEGVVVGKTGFLESAAPAGFALFDDYGVGWPGEKRDAAVAVLDEVLGSDIAAVFVIDSDAGFAGIFVDGEEKPDGGDVFGKGEDDVGFAGCGGGDDEKSFDAFGGHDGELATEKVGVVV